MGEWSGRREVVAGEERTNKERTNQDRMGKEGAMIDRGGYVRLLPTKAEPVDEPFEEWTEEIPESEIPPNDYQNRLSRLHQAEDGFYEELAATASEGPTPIE
jgi:hypothetical protein